MTNGEKKFLELHPNLKLTIKEQLGDISKLKKYTDVSIHGKIIEKWERNAEGELVDVTAKAKAIQELIDAEEAASHLGITLTTEDLRNA